MMTASKIEDDCKPCKKGKAVSEGKKPVGLLTTILLVLLPKCPFCLMAYSSTFILCGKAGGSSAEITHASSATIFIISFFCFAVLLSIIFNYRDARTKYALLLAVAGCFLIIYSVCMGGGLPLYYSGVFLVFIGVWLNASLLYVISKITRSRKII
jgi:membrane-associated HD superfamily phosphohydrolase